jgi:hypothetical protein
VIYFIACPEANAVKIGTTAQSYHASAESALFARLVQAQVNCPLKLEAMAMCDGGKPEEAELHLRFANLRIRGEWFTLTDDLKAFIAQFPTPVRPVRGWRRRKAA